MFFKMTGEECMLQEYQTVQLITRQRAEFHNKKSIHAIRRTLNSNMKCAGVSGTVAASLLGHTEKVNEENYRYDVSSMEEKSKFMECAGRV